MARTILITGASSVFEKLWADALLQRGDLVAATARDIATLHDLKPQYRKQILAVQLDITCVTNPTKELYKLLYKYLRCYSII